MKIKINSKCKSLIQITSQTHAWIRIKEARQKLLSSVKKQAIHSVWHRAYIDASKVYQQKKVDISKSDIEALFVARKLAPTAKLCVVPKKPSELLSSNNATLVSSLHRRLLHQRRKSRCVKNSRFTTKAARKQNPTVNQSQENPSKLLSFKKKNVLNDSE
jgi:hypothetical protein